MHGQHLRAGQAFGCWIVQPSERAEIAAKRAEICPSPDATAAASPTSEGLGDGARRRLLSLGDRIGSRVTAIAERTDHPNMRPSGLTYLYLAIMLVIWASNWPLMKLALADAPPLMFVFARLIGTLAV